MLGFFVECFNAIKWLVLYYENLSLTLLYSLIFALLHRESNQVFVSWEFSQDKNKSLQEGNTRVNSKKGGFCV